MECTNTITRIILCLRGFWRPKMSFVTEHAGMTYGASIQVPSIMKREMRTERDRRHFQHQMKRLFLQFDWIVVAAMALCYGAIMTSLGGSLLYEAPIIPPY